MIRDITEGERNRNLQEETDGSHGVTLEGSETEAADDGRRVGVEGTLGTVVAQGDDNVDIETPVGELKVSS